MEERMSPSPLLLFHICAGTLGMLSGYFAISFRKGSRRHRIAGNVFVIAMLSLSASGTVLAIFRHQPGNILGGALTFYLVATAWSIARHRDGKTSLFDWTALPIALAVLATTVTFALQAAQSPTGRSHGYPIGPYLIFGFISLIAAIGDVRMLARGGITGGKRVARHLWRMCFAWFIASLSIFLARPHLFPPIMRKSGALAFLSFLPLMLMIFWLIRVRFTRRRIPYELQAPADL
jgi:uncharacterized membrane protein